MKTKPLFGEKSYRQLSDYLSVDNISKIVILCDENTHKNCASLFLQQISSNLRTEIIEIEAGESNKDIAVCQQLWSALSEMGCDRYSALVNLGGGIITDLGGFVASTFLRGIRFVNVPTTLLGMVDAAIGGKTGVNRKGIKNQIGLFSFPAMTLIDTHYLETLPQNQLKSGLAEMLKHGLIADKSYWKKLSDLSRLSSAYLDGLVADSVRIKSNIVEKDTRENGLRKTLNFGHTLGHAIESHSLKSPAMETLLHGEAVAIGMVLESYLSAKIGGLSRDELSEIKAVILHTFKKTDFSTSDIGSIIELLQFDKKNDRGKVNFVLLKEIGEAKIDCRVSEELIVDAFSYYLTATN